MNISPDGTTVRFKTATKELFEVEKSGAKSNTVRIIDAHEYLQISKKPPKKIVIQYKQEIILRVLSHVYVTDRIFGFYVAIFSWYQHLHSTSIEEKQVNEMYPVDPPLQIQAINISLPVFKRLNLYRGERTIDKFISDMLDDYARPKYLDSTKQHGGSR